MKKTILIFSECYKVEELPKLGTGKADFKGAKKLAKELSDGKNISQKGY